MHNDNEPPFARLGQKLRSVRQNSRESLAEAAGAVEIDEHMLSQIEYGRVRPSEEILMLLINHFGLKDDDAVQLWELAGYSRTPDDFDTASSEQSRPLIMLMAIDPHVMYSDSVQITANKNGLIMNFMQSGTGVLPTLPAARIGMSQDHARKVLRLMQDTLEAIERASKPKQLPESTSDSDHSKS